ncbi:DUF3990 domain-containing protein [Bacillus cereus]|uniref:DUF3990 domain-containing protein n=1 Tax=Bacillus cereus TaxID=1396 RepID=UPI000BF845D0|nr:DUF3990 domain-containing protein [Bacillus cereus]PEZ29498.1 hypothetical protein CN361_28200 [Bacillus cereus]
MGNRFERYLKKEKWYHGTSLKGWKEICKHKVKAAYNIGNELDFGHGFYLTPVKEQAEGFINNVIKYRKQSELQGIPFLNELNDDIEDEIAVVIEFDFQPFAYYEDQSYNFGIFDKYDVNFTEFVFHNRANNVHGEKHHNFDLVFGVMSDSNPIVLINRYKDGIIGKNEVIEGLKKSTSFKQLSIHNQNLCDIIKPCRAYIIESGEELNVNDYFDTKRYKFTE